MLSVFTDMLKYMYYVQHYATFPLVHDGWLNYNLQPCVHQVESKKNKFAKPKRNASKKIVKNPEPAKGQSKVSASSFKPATTKDSRDSSSRRLSEQKMKVCHFS